MYQGIKFNMFYSTKGKILLFFTHRNVPNLRVSEFEGWTVKHQENLTRLLT